MPVFVRARARPMVRMTSRMAYFCTANTCSTGARSRDRLALPRRTCAGSGRPGRRRRWMWLMNPWRSRNVSFCCERLAVSAQMPTLVFVGSSKPWRNSCPSCRLASLTSQHRIN